MVGPGIWQETLKTWKMSETQCRTWNMVIKSEKVEK